MKPLLIKETITNNVQTVRTFRFHSASHTMEFSLPVFCYKFLGAGRFTKGMGQFSPLTSIVSWIILVHD